MSVSHMSNTKTIAKNTIFLYIRMLIMMMVSLYTTRIVLQALGIDDYGIYNVVGGIVVFFSFINSGLAGATKRYILAELAVGDIESQKRVFTLSINAHLLIIMIVLLLGETLGLWLLYNAVNVPPERMNTAAVVYQASLVTAVIGILQSPFSSLIISFEKMSIFAFFSIFDVLLKLGVVFLVQIIDGDKLLWYALLLVFIALFDFGIYFIYCRSRFEMCRYVKVKDNDTFFSILSYVGWTVFGSGANVLSKQGVNLLVNNFFSVAINAAMGVSNTIVGAASQLVSNLQVAFAPQITKNYIAKDYNPLIRLVSQSSRYTSFLILIILIPISIIISDLLQLWLGSYPRYSEEFCILTLICVYIEAVSMPLITVITAESKIRKYQLFIASLYVLCFILSWIVLLCGASAYSVMLVRASVDVAMVIVRLLFTKKKVGVFSISKWCKEVYGKTIIIAFLCAPLYFLNLIININNTFLRFVTVGSICVLWVAAIIYILGLNKREKNLIVSKTKTIIKY